MIYSISYDGPTRFALVIGAMKFRVFDISNWSGIIQESAGSNIILASPRLLDIRWPFSDVNIKGLILLLPDPSSSFSPPGTLALPVSPHVSLPLLSTHLRCFILSIRAVTEASPAHFMLAERLYPLP
jgi:hypothetical protein